MKMSGPAMIDPHVKTPRGVNSLGHAVLSPVVADGKTVPQFCLWHGRKVRLVTCARVGLGTRIEIRRYVVDDTQLPVRGEDPQVGTPEARNLRNPRHVARGHHGVVRR